MRILIFLLFTSISFFSVASCPHASWDKTVIVKSINDGDTVTLEDGQRVRFIGIDTPEVNHRNLSKSDAYAVDAKKLIERYIRKGDKLHLVFDQTKYDKYGRMLAYVYSKTGRNLALLQLQSGFAKHWVVGKNDKFWKCFQQAERQARLRKKGLWSDFSPIKADQIKRSDAGYQYISGRITDLQKSSKGITFVVDKKVTIKISKSNLKKFELNNVHFWLSQRVLLNGKLVISKKKGKITLYHPGQILKP